MHQIGSGVLGPVYRARRSDGDLPGERLFALKAFQVDLTPEQSIVFGDALQEMVELGLTHAAVVSPVGAGVADGLPYVAYEYVAGESLDVRMRPRVPLAAEAALPCIVRIAEALDAVHARGLVHGALHLRDVLITPDGARVGGFGLVAALDRVGHRCPLRPPYAAPEQIAGADWGEAADRYALAAVACELLTGRRAAAGGGMAGNVERALDARAAPRLTALLNAALATDPAGRPGSAGRFADDLAGALSWTGAAGVRRALAAAGGDGAGEPGGGPGPGRAERDSAIAAAGDPPVGEEPVVAAVGGTVMRKRKKSVPWRRKQSEVDWTDRALDLAPPVGRTGAGDPPVGAAAARERASAAGDPIDAALEGGGAPGDGLDGDGDLDLRAGADTLADVAEGLHAGLRDGRGTGAGGESEEAGPGSDAPAADAYLPISVGELESRVEGGGARPASGDEPSEAASEPRPVAEEGEDGMLAGDPAPGGAEPESTGPAETGDVDDDDGGFALTPEEGYDYGLEDEAEPEDPSGEIFGRGPADQARRLPVALVAVIGVAVAVTAFVIGLGWMGGDDGDAAVTGEEAGEAVTAGDPARAFSEAVVEAGNDAPAAAAAPGGDGAPVVASAGETSPPAGGAAPETPAPAPPRPAPVAAPVAGSPPPAALPPPEPVDAEGRLLVRSMPPGAEVIVNGESRGTTPLALAELPYGPYEVEVILAGYPPRREQFMLEAGDPIGSLNADLAAAPAGAPAAGGTPAGSPPAEQVGIGSILAETRPPGAEVWLDQRLVGETPMSIPAVPAGAHRIEFRLDGYRIWTTTVEVAPATQARVAASLADAAR